MSPIWRYNQREANFPANKKEILYMSDIYIHFALNES